mmetsp:Transcript_17647/g.44049  ORF Transcript_17647/g.44049 Transcript_17647/m.44049 type:complete len:170 (+) Transcript_17647:234-743(+)
MATPSHQPSSSSPTAASSDSERGVPAAGPASIDHEALADKFMDEFVAKIKPDIEARRVKMENEIRDLATENRAQLTNVQNEIHQRNRKLDSLERQCGELSARVTPFLALNDKCKELKLRLEDKEKECEALKEKCGRLEKQTIRDNNLFFGAVVLLVLSEVCLMIVRHGL